MKLETRLKSITICVAIVLFGTDYAKAGTWTILPINPSGIDGSSIVGGNQLYNLTTGNLTTINMPGAEITGIDGSNIVGRVGSHGFLYNGGNWTLLDMPGMRYNNGSTNVNGIDGDNIVGYYDIDRAYGFLYNSISGNWTTIEKPGAEDIHLTGIDASNIVGYYYDRSGNNHGFLHNMITGDWTTLDMPGAESASTHPLGIDGDNIVGHYRDEDGLHGFLYNGGNWTTLDMPGATFGTDITGIDGSNLVGVSGIHGFIYTIPEPAMLLLLGLGVSIVIKRR